MHFTIQPWGAGDALLACSISAVSSQLFIEGKKFSQLLMTKLCWVNWKHPLSVAQPTARILLVSVTLASQELNFSMPAGGGGIPIVVSNWVAVTGQTSPTIPFTPWREWCELSHDLAQAHALLGDLASSTWASASHCTPLCPHIQPPIIHCPPPSKTSHIYTFVKYRC